MIPSLDELRKSVHTKLNDLRSIEGLLGGDFEDVWTGFDDGQKLAIVNHVAWCNKTAISGMIKKFKSQELASKTIVQLRVLAKTRGLIGFMQMSKSTLLSELSKLEGLDYD
jgi:hypothetical protein